MGRSGADDGVGAGDGEQRCTQGDQRVGPQTGRFVTGLALQSEHGTERERQPADQFQ